MSKLIQRTVIGTGFLLIASFLLGDRFSTGEIIGLFFLVVAATI
ncbi:hypothetical protein [Burkholderia multivorans]|nr:hypothetical protein [Burkholderia multivorans]